MKKPMTAFLLIVALLLAAPVYAEIYKYTDETGQKRWTDDLSQVPKEQRAAAQRIETEQETQADTITRKSEKAQPGSPLETKATLPDTGAAGETDELSREALEKEKAELDLLYRQLMEERKQIEKSKPEANNVKTRAELNNRINAFNNQTNQYEERLNAFNKKINTFNQKIMSKQSPQKE